MDFSPGRRWLFTAGADGIVRIWALELDELVKIARDGLTRRSTDGECERYTRADGCP